MNALPAIPADRSEPGVSQPGPAPPSTGRAPSAADPRCVRPDDFHLRNARTVARARMVLALVNVFVLFLTPSSGPHGEWQDPLWAYGIVLMLIAYSFWVWREEDSGRPPAFLSSVATFLDVLFSAALIWSTGAQDSPFVMWNVFTIVGSALQNGWRTAVRVNLALIVFYVGICLPNLANPEFDRSRFVVQTSHLFVIAMVLAYMGQRLLEQNRMLSGLHRAVTHMTAGHTISDIHGRIADSLAELLEAEKVAVATWERNLDTEQQVLLDLDRKQGQRLLCLARECMAAAAQADRPFTVVSNDPRKDGRLTGARDALVGVENLLITRIPGSADGAGVLVACNRLGRRGFTHAQLELAELLAIHAGPLLNTARLQEQRRLNASVDERRRIAAELHDGLIQTLAGLDLRALACLEMSRNGKTEGLMEELLVLKLTAEEALREARGAVNELAPVRLREEGLAVFLEDALQKFREGTGIPVEASIDVGGIQVPEPTALLLIGLLREGLNNVRKHAHASHVTFRIAGRGDTIEFALVDDGIGYSPEKCSSLRAPMRHYGLAYLRERITAVDGKFRVISSPGAGTRLQASIPILTEARLIALLMEPAA